MALRSILHVYNVQPGISEYVVLKNLVLIIFRINKYDILWGLTDTLRVNLSIFLIAMRQRPFIHKTIPLK